MSETNLITISRQEERPFDYAALRQKAIEIVQKLSGKIWTDYNAHDPGITILEQIVFALTEVGYKSSFDIEDYLVSPDGKINYENQALYSASRIKSLCTVTQDDYSLFFEKKIVYKKEDGSYKNPEKVIFNIDDYNSWYKVIICVAEPKNDLIKSAVVESFWSLWKKWRCMGDLVCELEINWEGSFSPKVDDKNAMNWEHLPEGDYHKWNNLSPIIELFPAIYREGNNPQLLMDYLYPIEDGMRKFLRILENFPNIYSIDENVSIDLDSLDCKQCNSRPFNQMLAMYGVRFPKLGLVSEYRSICCKKQYLRELPELLCHRVGSSWRRHVELMLGILHDNEDPLKIYYTDCLFGIESAGRVRVVFFADLEKLEKNVRDEIEKFVSSEIPAHLLPIFFWKTLDEEEGFAKLYSEWMKGKPENYKVSPEMELWFKRGLTASNGGWL